ncbi:hypothetical protein DFH06DRAFT_1133449 [Mycena polygramma]|nr:hypothetical protein DFH06DRAFT_1133449 [Mycena polygramma]
MSDEATKAPSDGATKAAFKLEGEQRKFVDEFLPKFRDYERTLENKSGVKGLKKSWVLNNVAPPFITKFTPETDYRLDDVREAIKRYCYNNGIAKSGETAVAEKGPTKPPKATTALGVYVKENGKELAEAAKARTPPDHVGVQRQNLKYWGAAKTAAWGALDEKERKEFEKRAEDSNKELEKGAPASHVRENQSKAVQHLASALTKKMGWGWGGLGDIAVQLTGGFRNEDGKLKLFQLSMQPTENALAFEAPEPKEFVGAFKRWAGEVLPPRPDARVAEIADEADLTVLVGKEGSPALPDWNDDMSTNDVRRLLVLTEWLSYPTPAAMDDIVLSMQMAPDGKGDEDGVWETFRPATMDTGALHELYKRIVKDQNPEEPGALVFRDPRAEVADTVDEDNIAKGVKPVRTAKPVEPSRAKSNSSDPKVSKKSVAGESRLPDYALGAPAVPPASPAPPTPSPVGDDEGGGDGGQQKAEEKGAGDQGKRKKVKKVKKGESGATGGDDEGAGNGGQRKADEGSGSEKDNDQRGAAKAVPPPSPAPSALSSLSSIGDDEGGGNTGKRKADEEGEGGEKKKRKKAGAVGARPKPKTLGGGKASGAGGKQKSPSAAGGAATGATGSKKRKTADTAPAPLPAAKKPKPAPARGRVTRSTAEPPTVKAPRKLRPGRQIGAYFYFEYADNLPKGYSWNDDYKREWREAPDSDDDEN